MCPNSNTLASKFNTLASKFNGDISQWNVSNVTDIMSGIFVAVKFNDVFISRFSSNEKNEKKFLMGKIYLNLFKYKFIQIQIDLFKYKLIYSNTNL